MGNSKPGTEMHNFTNPPAKRVADFESGKSYMATTHTNEDLSTLSKPLKCWGRNSESLGEGVAGSNDAGF